MILRPATFFRSYLPALFAGLFLGACSLGGPLREDQKASTYKLAKVPRSWTSDDALDGKGKDTNGADHVFQDSKSKSLIAVNSVCFRYESTSLERLAHQYETGMKDPETLSEGDVTVDGRRALRVHLRGTFDGVLSEILVTVMRKNDCLFDFSAVGVSPLKPELVKDFDQWVQGFRYGVANEKQAD